MNKVKYVLLALTFLSCKKVNINEAKKNKRVFLRIETTDASGYKSYSETKTFIIK